MVVCHTVGLHQAALAISLFLMKSVVEILIRMICKTTSVVVIFIRQDFKELNFLTQGESELRKKKIF